jgi:hypothetical protein
MCRALFPANFGRVCLQALHCNPGLLFQQRWVLLARQIRQQLLRQAQDDVWAAAGKVLQCLFDVTPAADGGIPAGRANN